MLKIQLLDRRFFAAGRIKRMLVLCLLLTAVLVAGILWNTKRLQTRAADMQAQAAAAQANQGQVTTAEGEIAAVNSEVAPFDAQLDYIRELRDYSDNFPRYLRMLSRYIYNRADVLSAVVSYDGFQLQVRTKTTDDVAALMVNLKQAYKSNLIANDSLSIQGLTGWPNPTSPRNWSSDARRRIELPFPSENLQPVGSATTPPAPGGGGMGGASGMGGMGGSGMGGDMGGMSSPPMGGSGMGSSGPGMGGSGMGGGPPQMASAGGLRTLEGMDLATAQFFSDPQSAAHRTYIELSDDPPLQPYLNLAISGRWGVPFPAPMGSGAGGMGGGMGGMGGGMGGMGGPRGMMGPSGASGYESPPGSPMGGPAGSGM